MFVFKTPNYFPKANLPLASVFLLLYQKCPPYAYVNMGGCISDPAWYVHLDTDFLSTQKSHSETHSACCPHASSQPQLHTRHSQPWPLKPTGHTNSLYMKMHQFLLLRSLPTMYLSISTSLTLQIPIFSLHFTFCNLMHFLGNEEILCSD